MSLTRVVLRKAVPVVAVAAVACMPVAASAYVVTMDSFTVSANGISPFFTDNFGEGTTLTPGLDDSGIKFVNSTTEAKYGVQGTITESGDKAILDTGKGSPSLGPTGQPDDLDSATLSLQLKNTKAFSVTGVFDLTTPSLNGGYGIRLVLPTSLTNPAPQDVLELQVFETAGGPVVELTDLDFALDTKTVLDSESLQTDHQEILLNLALGAGSSEIAASYDYVDNGVDGALNALPNDGTYAGTVSPDFVEGGFAAFDSVPEPASLALFATALAGFGFRRRKR